MMAYSPCVTPMPPFRDARADRARRELLAGGLENLDLCAYTHNCLRRGRWDGGKHVGGIHTVGDLIERTAHDLRRSIDQFGRLRLAEVQDALAQHGLALKEGE